MADLEQLLTRLETLLDEAEQLDEPLRGKVFELLDGIDALHRAALRRLGDALDDSTVARLRTDAGIAWLFDAYGIGVDERTAAEAALEPIRPYIHSHGGDVEVLDVSEGVVLVKLGGSCSGCTASAVTLREGVERALEEGLPGFARLEVEEDEAAPHPPPGPTLVQLSRFEAR